MPKTLIFASLAAATAAGALIAAPVSSQAQPTLRQDAQVLFYPYAGRRYCWYDYGWSGPGWYWCGYAGRRGYGWGGGYGWRGWRGGHPDAFYEHRRGPRHDYPDHRDWRDHGDRDHHRH
jgi:hypothetical protein